MIHTSHYLLTLLILFCLTATGQFSRKDITPIALTLASGFFDGTAESLKFHYESVDGRYHLNDQFWNPAVSWRNKYKNGDPTQGAKFPGSTTFLVGATDGYHLMRTARNITALTAIVITIGDKQKWWQYLLQLICFYASYTIGFNLSYEILMK